MYRTVTSSMKHVNKSLFSGENSKKYQMKMKRIDNLANKVKYKFNYTKFLHLNQHLHYRTTMYNCKIDDVKRISFSITAFIIFLMFSCASSSKIESNVTSSSIIKNGENTMQLSSYHNVPNVLPIVNGNCSTCSSLRRNAAREKRIAGFKNEILSKLGLKSEPKVNIKKLPNLPTINEIIGTLGIETGYNNRNNYDENDMFNHLHHHRNGGGDDDDDDLQDEGDYEDFYVNTKRSITFAQKPPSNLNISNQLKAQYFKFSPKIYNSQITRANLWVQVKQLPQSNDKSSTSESPNYESTSCHIKHTNSTSDDENKIAWIVVYQVVKSNSREGPTLLHAKAQKVSISSLPGSTTLIQIDVKKLVSQWLSNEETNLGMVIHSFDNDGCVLQMGQVDSTKSSNLQAPLIEIKVDTRSQVRQRRMVGLTCDENSTETRCCRYPLVIDFDEMGWNWIIAPRKYEAHYCSGECSISFSQHTHSHLVNQATFGRNNLCCIPRKMSSISMLYYDENYNINQGILPGMVVERCGCI